MWHWRSVLIFAVSLSASVSGASATSAAPSPAAPDTSAGATYAEEADVLWKTGRELLEQERFAEAVILLARFVDRYPGHSGYLEAHRLLADAQARSGHPEKAVEPLRWYIAALRRSPKSDATPAQLLLGKLYLALKKFREAELLAREVEGSGKPAALPGALALKTRAQLGLKQESRAEKTLASALSLVNAQGIHASAEVRGELQFAKLELKLRGCARLPEKGPLAEDQVRSQLKRRGTCLLESLLPFREILKLGKTEFRDPGKTAVLQGFGGYQTACKNPPDPPALIQGEGRKRTAAELKTYREELAEVTQSDCRAKLAEAADLLRSWKAEPESSPFVSEVLSKLEESGESS